jgi:hypothetical protein
MLGNFEQAIRQLLDDTSALDQVRDWFAEHRGDVEPPFDAIAECARESADEFRRRFRESAGVFEESRENFAGIEHDHEASSLESFVEASAAIGAKIFEAASRNGAHFALGVALYFERHNAVIEPHNRYLFEEHVAALCVLTGPAAFLHEETMRGLVQRLPLIAP